MTTSPSARASGMRRSEPAASTTAGTATRNGAEGCDTKRRHPVTASAAAAPAPPLDENRLPAATTGSDTKLAKRNDTMPEASM